MIETAAPEDLQTARGDETPRRAGRVAPEMAQAAVVASVERGPGGDADQRDPARIEVLPRQRREKARVVLDVLDHVEQENEAESLGRPVAPEGDGRRRRRLELPQRRLVVALVPGHDPRNGRALGEKLPREPGVPGADIEHRDGPRGGQMAAGEAAEEGEPRVLPGVPPGRFLRSFAQIHGGS